MDLQNVFYTMGIVFMAAMFVLMIALIVLLLYIKNKVTDLQRNIQEKIEIVSTVKQASGRAVEVAVEKLREFIETKNKDHKSKNKEKR